MLATTAAVGTAVVWAPPMIDSIVTAASAGSAPPCRPTPGPCEISHLDVVVQHTGDTHFYGIKFSGGTWSSEGGGASDTCLALFTGGTLVVSGTTLDSIVTAFNTGATATGSNSGGWVITPPPGYTIVAGWSKAGGRCGPSGPCGSGSQRVFSPAAKNSQGNCGG